MLCFLRRALSLSHGVTFARKMCDLMVGIFKLFYLVSNLDNSLNKSPEMHVILHYYSLPSCNVELMYSKLKIPFLIQEKNKKSC